MINWHHEPRSRKLIAKLTPDRIERVKCIAIPNDYYIYVGADRKAQRTLRALEDRRTRAVERVAGCHFSDLRTVAECQAYIDIDAQAPNLYQVLSGEVA
jgi:Ni2+-binding GTPase involved in maturation of urease and hydrogenase